MDNKGEIIFYQNQDGQIRLKVNVLDETVWLNRNQMAMLFGRDVKTIGKHINNVFNEGELTKEVVVAKFATTSFLSNSPSLKILFICFPIVFTSLSNSKAI